MGVSAVVVEGFVGVIGSDEIIIVFIVHVFSVCDSEEGFDPVSNGEGNGVIWSCNLLLNASQNEEHFGGEGHRGFLRITGLD